jgi:hypothetical protein
MREAAADLEAIKKTREALSSLRPPEGNFSSDLGHSTTYRAIGRARRAFERYLETEEQLEKFRGR